MEGWEGGWKGGIFNPGLSLGMRGGESLFITFYRPDLRWIQSASSQNQQFQQQQLKPLAP